MRFKYLSIYLYLEIQIFQNLPPNNTTNFVFVDCGLIFPHWWCSRISSFYILNANTSSKKDVELSTQADQLTQQSTKIKTNIKLVIGGLKELQNISLEQKTPYRDAFA